MVRFFVGAVFGLLAASKTAPLKMPKNETFALVKLPTLWLGTLFIKIKTYVLEILKRVLT